MGQDAIHLMEGPGCSLANQAGQNYIPGLVGDACNQTRPLLIGMLEVLPTKLSKAIVVPRVVTVRPKACPAGFC